MPKNASDLGSVLTAIQEKYWRFDASEKASLLENDPFLLPWPKMLRLNHLCCLEMLETEEGKAYLRDPDAYPADLQAGKISELRLDLKLEFWPELLQKLVSQDSPYRPRHCLIWQGTPVNDKQREPDLTGRCMNASLTHFGSFEVIKVDADLNPMELHFVGLHEIRHIKFGNSGLFRATKLIYDDERDDEIVWMPLLYGVSWKCQETCDRDGSFTRTIAHIQLELEGMDTNFGIAIGHQDLLIRNAEKPDQEMVFGLGSIDEIGVALEFDDPKFEIRCRARGLNPDEVRRMISKGK